MLECRGVTFKGSRLDMFMCSEKDSSVFPKLHVAVKLSACRICYHGLCDAGNFKKRYKTAVRWRNLRFRIIFRRGSGWITQLLLQNGRKTAGLCTSLGRDMPTPPQRRLRSVTRPIHPTPRRRCPGSGAGRRPGCGNAYARM